MDITYKQAEKGKQSLDFTLYADHAGSKWRVVLERDFYDFQSKGSADRWDGTKWQQVFKCSPMRLKLGGYSTSTAPHFWEADATLDAEYMIGMAAMVIGEAARV
jgi:hypothetical protein